MRLSELDFGQRLGLETEKLPNFGILKIKLWNFVILVKMGILWTAVLKRGSCKVAEREWKGVFPAAHPRNPFQGKYPPPPPYNKEQQQTKQNCKHYYMFCYCIYFIWNWFQLK